MFDLCHCDVTQSYSFLSHGFHVLHCVNYILLTDAQISFEERKDVCGKYKYKYISFGKWGFLQLRLGLSSLYPQCLPNSVWGISHNSTQYYLYNIQKVGKSKPKKKKKKASLILIQTFNACLPLNNPFLFLNSLFTPCHVGKYLLCPHKMQTVRSHSCLEKKEDRIGKGKLKQPKN